jgi:antitoxin component of MazEF toxin-antitoxin module
MANRKMEERHVRKLSKTGGGSIYVILPIEMVRKFNWKKDQKVIVEQRGAALVIRDWKENT